MLETCAPTASPLVSGEPGPTVQVSSNEPAPSIVTDPPPTAVTVKSPATAVEETDELETVVELEEVEELDDRLPGSEGSGCRRLISKRTPPSQTMRTVEPVTSARIDGESGLIRHVLPWTVIECGPSLVIAPFAVHLGAAATAAGAVRPASRAATRAMRPTTR